MNKIRLRTKIEAIIVISFIMLLTAVSVASVTRTISDSRDDFYTFIRNSKGNYWEATETNIQAAIDDLTSGGAVWLPDCNISISTTIEMDNDISLIGVGKNSTLHLASNSNRDLIQINGKSNILIENVHLSINGNAQTTYDVKGIDITGSSRNIVIRGCYLQDGSASLIDIQEGVEYVTVEDCFFDGRKHQGYGGAIWISGSNCIVKNNMIQDTYACGIVMEAATGFPPTKWNIVDGNEITGEVSHGIHMEGATKSCNTTIINNHIHDLNSTAFVASEDHWSVGIITQNNSICSNNRIENVQQYGIQTTGDTTISGNVIKNIDGAAAIRSWNGRTVIDGNVIINAGIYGIKNGYIVSNNIIINPIDTGIADAETINSNYIKDCAVGIGGSLSNAIISSNTIIAYSYTAIDLGSDEDVIITSNNMQDGITAIRLSSAKRCIVSGNRVSGSTYSVREQINADYNVIDSNIFIGNSNSMTIIGTNTVIDNNIDS